MLWNAVDLKFIIHDQVGPGVYPAVFLVLLLLISIFLLTKVFLLDYTQIYSPFLQGLNEDLLIRKLGSILSEKLQTHVKVTTKNGTGRFSALWGGMNARSDGKTLMVISSDTNELPNLYAASHTVDKVEPIARIFFLPDVLLVKSDSKLSSLKQFLDSGKKKNDAMRIGLLHHPKIDYSVEKWLRQKVGLSFEAVADDDYLNLEKALIDGSLDALICGIEEASGTFSGDNLFRPLGVMSDNPVREHPSIPTFAQEGYPFISGKWAGIAVPKETPINAYEKISKSLSIIFEDKNDKDSLRNEGISLDFLDRQHFIQFMKKQKSVLEELNHGTAFPPLEKGKRFGLSLAILLTFFSIFLMGWIGFPLTAFLFLAVTMTSLWTGLNTKGIAAIVGISISVSLLIYFIFWQIFYVAFPGPSLFGG